MVVATDTQTFRDLLWRQLSPAQAVRSGAVRLAGEKRDLDRLLDSMPVPTPAQI